MSCIHLNGRTCSIYGVICDIPPSNCKYYKHPVGLYSGMDWSTIKEDEVEDMKKIFNKGPATNINCTCNKSTAENDYVSILEKFMNTLYPKENFRFFGFNAVRAEQYILEVAKFKGCDGKMVSEAFVKTVNNFKTEHNVVLTHFYTFCMYILLRQPYIGYPQKEYPFEYRFVLTLILGYLNKLTDSAIVIVDDVEPYFKAKIKDVPVKDLIKAVNQTRCYVKASNDVKLAEGMRKVEAWFEEIAKENIPPKELTIADIEKQLGYKIKIVGDDE